MQTIMQLPPLVSEMGIEVDEERAAAWEAEHDKIEIQNKLKLSNIPDEYRCGFDSYICSTVEENRLLQEVKRAFDIWVKTKFITVVLLGDNGIGKTKLANAFLYETLKYTYELHGLKCHYSIRYVLMDEIRERYEAARSYSGKQNQSGVIAEYGSIDILVIDEIGMGNNPKENSEILYRITNMRDLNKKTTLFCGNQNFNEFAQFLGRATMDRLRNSAVFPNTKNIKTHRGK